MSCLSPIPSSYDNYAEKENNRELIGTIIRKQMDLIGHKLALTKAHKIPDLSVTDQGHVITYYGEPENIIEKLLIEYSELTGEAAYFFSKKAVEQLLKTNHNVHMPKVLAEYVPKSDILKAFSQSKDISPN